MQLSKEEYARKRIHNGSSVQTENSITRVTILHHSASLVMPNNYPRDGIFNQHLTTIKDSYITPDNVVRGNQKLCKWNPYGSSRPWLTDLQTVNKKVNAP